MKLFDSIADGIYAIGSWFRSTRDYFRRPEVRSKVGTFVSTTNTSLAGWEVGLFGLILLNQYRVVDKAPEFLFPYIVTHIGAINVPVFLANDPAKPVQTVNNLVGGWTTTICAVLALNPMPEGIEPADLFAAALIINTLSFMYDGLLKLKDNSLEKIDGYIKLISCLKNMSIAMAILVGSRMGEVVPGMIFEKYQDEPETTEVLAWVSAGLAFGAFCLGMLKLLDQIVNHCKSTAKIEVLSDQENSDLYDSSSRRSSGVSMQNPDSAPGTPTSASMPGDPIHYEDSIDASTLTLDDPLLKTPPDSMSDLNPSASSSQNSSASGYCPPRVCK